MSGETWSVGKWLRAATPVLEDIAARGRTAIVVGGTGLYFRALTQGLADIPAEHYAVPGTGFSKDNAPPYMVSMGWMFHEMVRAIRTGSPASSIAASKEKLHPSRKLTMSARHSARMSSGSSANSPCRYTR